MNEKDKLKKVFIDVLHTYMKAYDDLDGVLVHDPLCKNFFVTLNELTKDIKAWYSIKAVGHDIILVEFFNT